MKFKTAIQGAQDHRRNDAYIDIEALEIVTKGQFDLGKFYMITDSTPYINQSVKGVGTVFATTVHELAHVSHWEIGYSTGQYVIDALADDPFLPESWAVGVEHTITNRVYPNRGAQYEFPYENDLQHYSLDYIRNETVGYTPIVIDLIDAFNQSTVSSNRPNDRFSGYTLGQLEDALPGSFGSWWTWRSRIRSQFHNANEGEPLDYLFRQYR